MWRWRSPATRTGRDRLPGPATGEGSEDRTGAGTAIDRDRDQLADRRARRRVTPPHPCYHSQPPPTQQLWNKSQSLILNEYS